MTSFRSVVLLAGVAVLASLAASRVENGDLSEDPMAADLAMLESGAVPENRHVALGPHLRVYHYLAFEYDAEGRKGDPAEDAVVTEAYFPVVSLNHPYATQLMELEQEYGNLAQVPSDVEIPELESFRVLARTTEFERAGDLPSGVIVSPGLDGVVRSGALSETDVRDFELAQAFPQLDQSALLVLDVGGVPISGQEELWLAGVGGGLVLLGGIGVAASRRREEHADSQAAS